MTIQNKDLFLMTRASLYVCRILKLARFRAKPEEVGHAQRDIYYVTDSNIIMLIQQRIQLS